MLEAVQPSASARGKLVVAHPERKAQRTLQRMVGATMLPVEVVEDVDALVAATGPDTIAIVDMNLAQARPDLPSRPARAWIAVPGEGLAAADAGSVASLLGAGWNHIIAHPMPVLVEELLATVQKSQGSASFANHQCTLSVNIAYSLGVSAEKSAD